MSKGKYLDGDSGKTYETGSPNMACGGGQAMAWDVNSQSCYKIYGVAVTIGDTVSSIHAGFEVCNFNWNMMDVRPSVVNVAQLGGPIGIG